MKKTTSIIIAAATLLGSSYAIFAHDHNEQPRSEHSSKHDKSHSSKHGKNQPIFKMIERHLELTEAQQASLDKLKQQQKPEHKKKPTLEYYLTLDPSATNYQQTINQQAELISQQVKDQFLFDAAMHADIYQILTAPQREQLLSKPKNCKSKKHDKH
ncbi:hypothetical protein A9Q78_07605 [Methylophaga sp. 41_12_T18]|nr:hypothetical protein A9Q78_07605 [Methylophaga sp. 41_12_T18]